LFKKEHQNNVVGDPNVVFWGSESVVVAPEHTEAAEPLDFSKPLDLSTKQKLT
jgi:hypothetical protein